MAIMPVESVFYHECCVPGITLRCFASLPSTNVAAAEAAQVGAPAGTLFIADSQSAGRGRLGRTFVSPAGTGLYMSLILRPSFPASDVQYVTPCAAVAAAEALEGVSGKSAGIKWVNDIYMAERKVCGILTQASFADDGRPDWIVLGIGVNLLPPMGGFPAELRDKAGAVFGTDETSVDRMTVAANIINRFYAYYPCLSQKQFLDGYRRRSVLDGKCVLVGTDREGYHESATVQGITDEFGLSVRMEDGTETVLTAGEVSVKTQ